MKEGMTWVLVADGTFIKIMTNDDGSKQLKALRDDDFEHTSNLTYGLITMKRSSDGAQALSGSEADRQEYFITVISDFLQKKVEENAFQRLLLVAPDNILVQLQKQLPAIVTEKISDTVAEDHLRTPFDRLEDRLKDLLLTKHSVGRYESGTETRPV